MPPRKRVRGKMIAMSWLKPVMSNSILVIRERLLQSVTRKAAWIATGVLSAGSAKSSLIGQAAQPSAIRHSSVQRNADTRFSVS